MKTSMSSIKNKKSVTAIKKSVVANKKSVAVIKKSVTANKKPVKAIKKTVKAIRKTKEMEQEKMEVIPPKSKPFEAGDLLSVKVGADHEENFRKFVIPQKHKLLMKLQRNDQAVVFIKSLPFGMTEKNLMSFMNQFGTILRCRMPTNPRNGRTKGFAYVHYDDADVARIACSTMDNYLMLGNSLECVLIPSSNINEKFFAPDDDKHHLRVNKSIKVINGKRSERKLKKLSRKRCKGAIETLKSMNSAIKPEDLAINM